MTKVVNPINRTNDEMESNIVVQLSRQKSKLFIMN